MSGAQIFLLIVGVIVLAIIAAVVYEVVDRLTATTKIYRVKILHEHFESERTSLGVGFAGNGPAVVSSTMPERSHLQVEFPDGERRMYETDRDTLVQVEPGEKAALKFRIGGLSKCVLSVRR